MGLAVEKDDRRLDTLLARGQGARGDRLRLRGRRRVVRAAGAAHARHRARTTSTSRASTSPSSAGTTPLGKLVSVSEAVVKLTVGGERLLTVGEGNGPVNALDRALRKDLGVYSRRHRRPRTHRLQGPYPQRRHRGGHPRPDRIDRRLRRLVVHRRRLGEHRRRLVRGAERFDRLQAAPRRG